MKRAFTIAEFVISIMIMFIIMAAAITIPFKKAKKTLPVQKVQDKIVCSCADPKVITDGYECEVEIKNSEGRYEFYTIQLLGGGGAGGAERGGGAGEARMVHYPLLEGKYLIKLGEGGKSSSAINGGNTVLYKLTDEGKYEIIEYARGGIGSADRINTAAESSDIADLQKGETPAFAYSNQAGVVCGAGGDKGNNGQYGEVVIKW